MSDTKKLVCFSILKAVQVELETEENKRNNFAKSEYCIVEDSRIEDQWGNVHFDPKNGEMVSWFAYLPAIAAVAV